MPLNVSDPTRRWAYAEAELDELEPGSRPPADLATPAPTPCQDELPTGDPCPATVPPRWVPPRYSLPGHWNHDRTCPGCQARRARLAARRKLVELVGASGIPARYAWATFDRHLKQAKGETWPAFRDRLDVASEASVADGEGPFLGITAWNAPAAMVVRDWTPGPTERPTPRVIFLTGPVGSGKTTLAAAAAMGALRRQAALEHDSAADRYRIRWVSEGDLWETLRLEIGSRKRQRGALAAWAGADVLVLDDLGTLENVKDWHRDAMEFLICNRYNSDRPTLITSNLRLDSEDPTEPTIATIYGERVVSRLVEGMGGRRRGAPRGYQELLGMDWRADVPHPAPDPSRPASPSAATSTTTPSNAVHRPRQLSLGWKDRQAGAHLED